MNILIAPDSFKESLDSEIVAECIKRGILMSAYSRNIKSITKLPLSDGGEGFLERIIKVSKGKIIQCASVDPLERKMLAKYGSIQNKTAIIESANVCGYHLVSEKERNPLKTTSYGLGLIIKDAVERGFSEIIIGLGGSITNDGGSGLAQALGIRLLDQKNEDLKVGVEELLKIDSIDLSYLSKKFNKVRFTIACNPSSILCGEKGTSLIYSFQKGATKKEAFLLDKVLVKYASAIKKSIGIDVKYLPGSRGAGGIGAACISFLNAKVRKSMDVIEEYLNLEEHIANSDLVITGEGKLDKQTATGKVVERVCTIGKKYDVPVIAIVGQLSEEVDIMYEKGLMEAFSLCRFPQSLDYALKHVKEELVNSSYRLMNFMNLGGILAENVA